MVNEKKLNKISKDFTRLPDEKQDYILGVLQALVFAKEEGGKAEFPSFSPEQRPLKEGCNGV
jgi:hypothetical protein